VAEDVALSKRMAYVLRHDPGSAGLELDAGGWVDLAALVAALDVDLGDVEGVVRSSSKQRYAILDGRIRAQQGHSVPVDLGLGAVEPPGVLWHGTAEHSLASILEIGLERRSRHHVHLSADVATAEVVGRRHGKPVVLRVEAGQMHENGWAFSVSGNGVWLVEAVPPRYLTPVEGGWTG
jgi:putative RNA 2'-phosphotransferase